MSADPSVGFLQRPLPAFLRLPNQLTERLEIARRLL